MIEILKPLNEEQYEAATTIDGRVFILAGAGSGKTSVLIARTAQMLETGIKPENILLITFTKAATDEMEYRLHSSVGESSQKVVVKTFHGFCMRILYAYSKLTGFPCNFKILSSPEALEALEVCKEKFLTENKMTKSEKKKIKVNLKDFPSKKKIYEYYCEATEKCVPLNEILKGVAYGKAIKTIISLYTDYKEARQLMDYEDMMRIAEEQLRTNPDFKRAVNNQFQYVSCDEYQDTNIIQNKILDYITEEHGNLAVVGDDNQSIYAFRFANVDNILSFADRYPDCKKIILNKNYRSTQEILDFSNTMMEYAPEGIPKTLVGTTTGNKPMLVSCEDDFYEAKYVSNEIHRRYKEGEKLSDIAVLCRNGFQSYIIESELASKGLPYKKFGGMKFTDKTVIRTLLSYLKISESFDDEIALITVLRQYPGIGSYRAQICANAIRESGFAGAFGRFRKHSYYPYLLEFVEFINELRKMNFEEKVYHVCQYYISLRSEVIESKDITDAKKSEEYAYLEDSIEDIEIFMNLSLRFISIADFVDNIATESLDADVTDFVNISTIHSSKGLEYKTVFILDCVDGVFPKEKDDYAEDLRCMYVAATRAKENLYIMKPYKSTALKRFCTTSSFINQPKILKTLSFVDTRK